MAKVVASSILSAAHLVAFDDLAKERLEGLDLSVLLMYVIDTAPASALYDLADQFDVLGWKGWNLAATDEAKRALIKNAIKLHRYKGTVWSIKEAVKSVGFDGAEVKEGVGVDYDGAHNHDGDITYGSGGDNWANFRVTIFLPDGIVLDIAGIDKVRRLILEYKNARSHLVDITFNVGIEDEATVSDEIALSIFDDDDNLIEDGNF